MTFENDVQQALVEQLDRIDPPRLQSSTIRRIRIRRIVSTAAMSVTLLFFGAASLWLAQDFLGQPQARNRVGVTGGPKVQSSPSPSDSPPSTCESGPWTKHCPEAQWTMKVAAGASFRVSDNTGSAFVIKNDEQSYYLWAFPVEGTPEERQRMLKNENYRLLEEIEGIAIYSDGLRLTWEVHELYVWLEAGPSSASLDVDTRTLQDLVRSSKATRYP